MSTTINLNVDPDSDLITLTATEDNTLVTINVMYGEGSGGGGGGDVVGASSSVNNNVVFFDGTTGKLIKDSGLTLSGNNTGDETNATIKTKLGQASTSTDGWLSSTDWNTFNTKQVALVSGTNIKSVNGTTLLGSGDLQVGDVLTTGSYANPIWITSLAWSKITGTPTTLAGYGITDGWRLGGDTLTAETILGGSSGAFGLNIQTNGLTAMKVLSSPASAVNYLTVISAVANSSPIIAADGTDTNINLTISPKGSGITVFRKVGESGIRLQNNTNYWDVIIGGGGLTTTNYFALGYNGNVRFNMETTGATTLYDGLKTNYVRAFSFTSGITVGFNTTQAGAISATSGNYRMLRLWDEANNSFLPTSGTATLRILDMSAFTINQTGTASGDITLINANPILTNHNGVFSILRSALAAGTNRFGLYLDNLANYLGGNTSIGDATNTARLNLGASTTAKASLRILAGTAPASPNEGDIWQDGTNIKMYIGGATKTFTLI